VLLSDAQPLSSRELELSPEQVSLDSVSLLLEVSDPQPSLLPEPE
jgi:hypothetical protein